MQATQITVSIVVDAELSKVWQYYTDPKHIIHWNFASPDWQCPSAENDLRVGGLYKARMEAKDGSFGFDFEAIYSELELGKRFTYGMPDDRQVRVRFETVNANQTRLTIVFDAETENPIEFQQQGWQMILNNFKQYAERI